MDKGTVCTCLTTLAVRGGGSDGVTYYVKTKNIKGPTMEEVIQYRFDRKNLETLNDKELQKWMLLTLKFICQQGSSEFGTYSYKFLEGRDSDVDKLVELLPTKEGVNKSDEAKRIINEVLDKSDKNTLSGGMEVGLCKDVNDVLEPNKTFLDEFNVEMPNRYEISFKKP